MLKSGGWFTRTFPTLARCPADKWLIVPMAFILTVSVLVGVVNAIFENPEISCDLDHPCNDLAMKQFDEYLCTGRVGNTGSFEKQLAACRKKLGKPAVY